jgi:hypothetical protein
VVAISSTRRQNERLRDMLLSDDFATQVRNAYYTYAGIRVRNQMTVSAANIQLALKDVLTRRLPDTH